MSSRTRPFALALATDHLHEDAVDAVWMDERDLMPTEAGAGLGVGHLDPLRDERAQRGGHVRNLVGDVVHPRPPLGEEAADRRVLTEPRDELAPSVADPQVRSLYALVVHPTSELDPRAEEPLIGLQCLVEIRDGERDVMD